MTTPNQRVGVRFATSYIDRLFAERDFPGLHHLISILERDRALPEECWLFCRIIEWVGSTRSGVWQYYESVPKETFERVAGVFGRFGHTEIAERYRSGMIIWNGPDRAASLDKWMWSHEGQIEDAAFEMIKPHQELLRNGA
jgi:hypothetical protein